MFNRNNEMLKTAFFNPKQWIGFIRLFLLVKNPISFIYIYLTLPDSRLSDDSLKIRYRDRGIVNSIEIRGPHDYCTFFEVYCRRDYSANVKKSVVVDVGSNIGITARFFLENQATFIYLFEPDRDNVEILKRNLTNFKGRYQLNEKALGITTGMGIFQGEKTGRYGRLSENSTLTSVNSRETLVEVIGVEEALDMVLRNHDQIGLLKIDIEGLELEVIDAIPEFQKLKIAKIQYEIYPEGVITI
jgi:FkbM family methyltransferase